MPIEVTRMAEADIDGAIDTIQQAFADDPYNNWIYPDNSKVRTHFHQVISKSNHDSNPSAPLHAIQN